MKSFGKTFFSIWVEFTPSRVPSKAVSFSLFILIVIYYQTDSLMHYVIVPPKNCIHEKVLIRGHIIVTFLE